jgi:hypothetical protein
VRQAIQTKWLGPTNRRGSRVKAWSDAGSKITNWDYSLGIEGNHAAAALALARKLGWEGKWIGGGLAGSGCAFVQDDGSFYA